MQTEEGPPVFDHAAALERVDGDEELLAELAGLFLEDAPGLLAQIKDGVAQRDGNRLERAAHSLKGSASNIDALATVEAARALETIARDGELSQVGPVAARVEGEVARLTDVLTKLTGGQG